MACSPQAVALRVLVAAASLAAAPASAQTIVKGATGTELTTATNWTGGAVPGSTNVAEWASTSLGTGLTLASSLTWQGINVTGALADIAVSASSATSVLSIGSSGITLAGTRNLTLGSSLAFTANQTWTIAGGRSMVLIGASRNATGTGNISIVQSGTGVAAVRMSQNGNTASWAGYSGNITVNSNVKVQSEGNAAAAFGTGSITLAGGAIHQLNGSWTWGNNIDVTAASVIGQDSGSGLGRHMKLLGNLTSANGSGLTFTNTTTGGTRNDNVGFILAGTNTSTYSTTTISANSRLRVGGNSEATTAGTGQGAGTRGSLGSGAVTLSAATSELAFTRTDAHTVSNAISGAGTVIFGGNTSELAATATQVVTLSGASTYTGATRVSRSRLNLTGSLTSAITVDNAGSISGTGSTTGLLTLSSGTSLVLAGGATTTSLTVNGATFAGSNSVTFLNQATADTVYDVFTYGNGTVTTISNLTVGWRGTLSDDTVNKKYIFTAGGSGTRTWTTTTGTWEQNGASNFAEGDLKFFGGDAVVFGDIASDAAVTLAGTLAPGSVTVSNAANIYTFSGTAISGATGLTKSGNGTLVLSTANTYAGGTTLSAGTLRAGNASSLGAGLVTVSGGTLDVAAVAVTNAISLSGTGNGSNPALWNSAVTGVTLAGAITLAADATAGNATTAAGTQLTLGNLDLNGKKLTITSGAVSVDIRRITNGNIEVASGGTLYSLTGGSLTSATGTITVKTGGRMETRDTDNTGMTSAHDIVLDGGTLSTAVITNNNGGGGGTILRNNLSVTSAGGALVGNNTAFLINLRLTGSLSGTGNLDIGGAQGVELRGDATNYTGTATVTAGTLTFNYGTNQSFGGVLAGARPVVKSGVGTLTLLADNTLSGTLTLSNGALQVGNGGTAGTLGTATVTNNASLIFNRSDALTVANAISGSGSLTQSGSGSTILTGANTYGGTTTISGGTLEIGSGGTTGTLGSGTVTNNSALIFNRSDTITVANAISGTGSLTKISNGTLILTGTNSYGTTTISAGTLQIGSAGTSGSLGSGAVTNNAALVFNRSDAVTAANAISGTGSLTKLGSSSLTLTGTNTYTGTTTVSNGTLTIGSTGSLHADSALSVASGATLSVLNGGRVNGASAISGTLTGSGSLAAVTLSNGSTLAVGAAGLGTLTLDSLIFGQSSTDTSTLTYGISGVSGSAQFTSALQVNGEITVNSGSQGVTFALGNSLATLAGGTVEEPLVYDLITYTGSQLTDISAFTFSGTTGARQNVALANGTKTVQLVVSAAFPIWKGSTADWSDATAWKLNSTSADTAFLSNDTVLLDDTASSGVVNLTANVAPLSITFANSTVNYSVGSEGGFGLTSGSIIKSGTASVTLTGSNSFAGGTSLSAGRIRIGSDTALGSGLITVSGGALSSDGSTDRSLSNALALSGSVTMGDATDSGKLSFSGAVSIAPATSLNLLVDTTLSGALSGGVLTKSGNGVLTLSTSNSNTGFILDSGRLRAGSNTALGTSTFTLGGGSLSSVSSEARSFTNAISLAGDASLGNAEDNGALALSGAINLGGATRTLSVLSPVTVSGAFSNGTLIKSGLGTLTVSGANSLGIATTISQGTLALGAAGSVSDTAALTVTSNGTLDLGGFSETTGAVTLSGGTISNGTLVAALSASSGTFTAILGGSGSLTKSGNGTLVLTTANTYSGTTTINEGTLQIGSGGTVGTIGSGAISNAGTLAFNRSDAVTVANVISGAGSVSYSGGGTFTVSGASSYEGGTVLNAGVLQVSNAAGIGSGNLTINGGTLTTGATQLTLTNNITLNSGLTLTGTAGGQGMRLAGVISGEAGITVNLGAGGRTTFLGDNTYTGATSITGGILAIGLNSLAQSSSVTIGAAGQLAIATNGGTTILNNLSGEVGSQLISSFNIVSDGLRPIKVNQSVDGTFAGTIAQGTNTRAITLTKSGTATLTLSGSNTYNGGVNLSQGTLIANHGNALGNGGTVTINDAETGSNNTTLRLGSVTVARAITVANQGSGVVTLGANGSVALPEFSGAITLNRSVVLDGSTNTDRLTFTGGIVGTGDVTVTGTGRVVFASAANTFTGNLTVSANSILQLSAGSATATSFIPDAAVVTLGAGSFLKLAKGSNNETIGGLVGSGRVRAHEGVTNAAAVLTINNTTDHTFAGVLENGGASNSTLSLTKSGEGTQVLTGTNTFSGVTTISSGILQIGDGGTSGSLGSGTVTNNATLTFNRSDDILVSNVISGTGVLTKNGDGTLTLSGENTFSGGLVLNTGKVIADNLSAFGSGSITLLGGILDLNNLAVTNSILFSGGTLINSAASSSALVVSGQLSAEEINNLPVTSVTLGNGAIVDLTGITKDVVITGAPTLNNLASFEGNLAVAGALDLSLVGNRPAQATLELRTGGSLNFGAEAFTGSINYAGGAVSGAFNGQLLVTGGQTVTLTASAIPSGLVVVGENQSVAIDAQFDGDVLLTGGTVASGLASFAGNLTVGNGGQINLTTQGNIASANLVVENGGRLSGIGDVGTATVTSGGVLAPGNSPGTQTFGSLTLQAGGVLEAEVLSVAPEGIAGVSYDTVSVAGFLDLTALSSANRFTIDLISLLDNTTLGDLTEFDPQATFALNLYTYTFLGSNVDNVNELFTVLTNRFTAGGVAVDALNFSVVDTGASIQLVYAPIPEPSTYGLMLGGLALAAAAWRRRKSAKASAPEIKPLS